MYQSDDGTVYKDDGTVIIFSIERFLTDIVQGDCCFICGRSPALVQFNDEHVIPDWLLRKHGLHELHITLPNESLFRYSQYKVPCCADCNSRMGDTFETPISRAFDGGFSRLADFASQPEGKHKIFAWLCLIYLKTHLKDLSLRMHRDRRLGDERIARIYEWEHLHHIQCVARSFLSGASIDEEVFGSMILLPGKDETGERGFDYGDNYLGRTMMLRSGQSVLFAVLNDAGATLRFRADPEQRCIGHPLLSDLHWPLSHLQAREMLAELAYVNIRIEERPIFLTVVDQVTEKCAILAETPEGYHLGRGDEGFYGRLLHSVCQNVIDSLPEPDRTIVREQTLTGRYSFLWENGTQRRSEV